jgi:hypothetical protein
VTTVSMIIWIRLALQVCLWLHRGASWEAAPRT